MYAGATFTGGFLLTDNAANKEFYQDDSVTSRDILFNSKAGVPAEVEPLIKDLEKLSAPAKAE